MRFRATTSGISFIATLALAGPAWSQIGTVLTHQTISDTQGNFTEPLANLDEFGTSVANLGDLDGAGPSVVALAVGTYGDDDGGFDRGAVYILFLDGTGNVLSYQKISSTAGNFTAPLESLDEFGGAVAYLGDLDGAGPSAAALAVSAVGDNDGGTTRGAVYVLFLASTGNVLSYQKISDTAGNFTAPLDNADEFGSALGHLGDLDGGGPSVAALAASAVGDDDGGLNCGAVYVIFLNSAGSALSYQKISETQGNFAPLNPADEFGTGIAALGDLDGAGASVRALAVGAFGDNDGGNDRGAVYVLFLAATGSVLSYQKISDTAGDFDEPLANEDEFGNSVAHLGDLDGSGPSVTTLAVGAVGDDDGGSGRGAVYLLFLSGTGNVLSYQKISDTQGNFTGEMVDGDQFGGSLTALGDLDGSGASIQAVAVGAPGDTDGGGEARGAVHILFLAGNPPVDVDDPAPRSSKIMLGQAVPNPFNPKTTIPFRISEPAWVQIHVWDIHGRMVRKLFQGRADPGEHWVDWDGRDDSGRSLASGTYFYRMSVNGSPVTVAQKALLLR